MKKTLYYTAIATLLANPALADNPNRIVAIGNGAAETISALGKEKLIIAVDVTIINMGLA